MPQEDEPKLQRQFQETLTKDQLHDLIHSRKKPGHWEDGIVSYFRVYKIIEMLREENKPCTPHLVTAIDVLSDGKSKIRNQSTYDFSRYVKFQVEHHVERTDEDLQQQVERLMPGCLPIGPECESLGITGDILFDEEKSFEEPIPLDRITNRVIYELIQFLPRVLENQQSMAKWLKKILHLPDDQIPSVDLITKWCSVLHKETSRKRRSSMSLAQQYLEKKFSFTDFNLESLQKKAPDIASSSTLSDADDPSPHDKQDQPMQISVEGDEGAEIQTVDDPMEPEFSGNENGGAENVNGIIAEAIDILDQGETQMEQEVSAEKLSDPTTADKESDAQDSGITKQDGCDSATITGDDFTPKPSKGEQLDESQKSGGHVPKTKKDSKTVSKGDMQKARPQRNTKNTHSQNKQRFSTRRHDNSHGDDASDNDEVSNVIGRKHQNGALDKATLHKNLAKASRIIKTVLRVVSRLKKEMHVTMSYLESETGKLCDDLKHEQERLKKAKTLIDDSSDSVKEETEKDDDSEEESEGESRNRSSKNTKMITVQVKPGVKDTLKKPLVRLRPLACQRDADSSDFSDLHNSESSSDSDMKSEMRRAERKVTARNKLVTTPRNSTSASSVGTKSKPKVSCNRNVGKSSASPQCSSRIGQQKSSELKLESDGSPANHVNDFDKAKLFSSRVCVSLKKLSQEEMERAERRNDEIGDVEEMEDKSLGSKSSKKKIVQKSKSRARREQRIPETDSETEQSEEEDDIQGTPEKPGKSTHTDSSEEDQGGGTTARKPLRRNRITSSRSKPENDKAGESGTRKTATSKGSRSGSSRNGDLCNKDAECRDEGHSDEGHSDEGHSDEQKRTRSASSSRVLKSAKQTTKTLQGNRQQQHHQRCSAGGEPSSTKEKSKKRSLDDFVKELNSGKKTKMSAEKKMPEMKARRGRGCKDIKLAEESPSNEDDFDCKDNEDDDFLEKATEQELQRLNEEEIGQKNPGMPNEACSEGATLNGELHNNINSTGDGETKNQESSNVSQMDMDVDGSPPLIENQVDIERSDSVQEVASSGSFAETKGMGSEEVERANDAGSGLDPLMEVEVDENPLLDTNQDGENSVGVAAISDSYKVDGGQEKMVSNTEEPGHDPEMDVEVDTSSLSSGKQFEEDKTDGDNTDAETKDPESGHDSQMENEVYESLISYEKQEVVVNNIEGKGKGKMSKVNGHILNGQMEELEDVLENGVLEGGCGNMEYHGLEEDSGSIEGKEEGQVNAESRFNKTRWQQFTALNANQSKSEEPAGPQSPSIPAERKAKNNSLQCRRKVKNEQSKNSKISKTSFPGDGIVGKQVRHRCSLGHPDIYKWYKGKVLRKSTAAELLKLGEEHFHHLNNLFTIYAVKYEEYTDVAHEALEHAWRKGWLKIVS